MSDSYHKVWESKQHVTINIHKGLFRYNWLPIGAVLLHVMGDGSEKLVAYASHTLNDIEKRYS